MAIRKALWEAGLKQAVVMTGRITGRQETELWKAAQDDQAALDAETPHQMAKALEPLIRGIRVGNRRPPPPKRKNYRAKPVLSAAEAARAEISTWRGERRASQLEWVRSFRERFLPGALLDRAMAIEFLTAAPYRLLTVGEIVQAGLPTAGLRGTESPPALADGTPVPAMQAVSTPLGRAILVASHGVRCTWTAASGNEESRDLVAEVPLNGEDDLPSLEWQVGPAENQQDARMGHSSYRRGSVIAELAELADFVSACMWWPAPLAAWFVLTGEVPASRGVEAELSMPPDPQNPLTELRIVLKVEPWVSREAVDRAYHDRQRWAVGTGGPFKLKRASEEPALRRFLFVSKQIEAGITSFREMAEAWSSESGAQGKGARISAKKLERDYVRTRDTILRPLAMGRSKKDMGLAILGETRASPGKSGTKTRKRRRGKGALD